MFRQPLRGRHVVPVQRRAGPEDGEPTVLGRRPQILEDAGGAPEPAVGHGRCTPELDVGVPQPQRHPGRAARVTRLPVHPVRALAGIQARGHVLEPPIGPAHPLERGRGLPGQCLPEAGARLEPPAPRERGPAGSDGIVSRRKLGHATNCNDHRPRAREVIHASARRGWARLREISGAGSPGSCRRPAPGSRGRPGCSLCTTVSRRARAPPPATVRSRP